MKITYHNKRYMLDNGKNLSRISPSGETWECPDCWQICIVVYSTGMLAYWI